MVCYSNDFRLFNLFHRETIFNITPLASDPFSFKIHPVLKTSKITTTNEQGVGVSFLCLVFYDTVCLIAGCWCQYSCGADWWCGSITWWKYKCQPSNFLICCTRRRAFSIKQSDFWPKEWKEEGTVGLDPPRKHKSPLHFLMFLCRPFRLVMHYNLELYRFLIKLNAVGGFSINTIYALKKSSPQHVKLCKKYFIWDVKSIHQKLFMQQGNYVTYFFKYRQELSSSFLNIKYLKTIYT